MVKGRQVKGQGEEVDVVRGGRESPSRVAGVRYMYFNSRSTRDWGSWLAKDDGYIC